MTTGTDKATLKQQLRRDGRLEFFYHPPPQAQYYRADGRPLPNLLPADPYAMKRYLAKGFTLAPPTGGVPTESAVAYPDTVIVAPEQSTGRLERIDDIAEQRQANRQKLYEDAAQGFEVPKDGVGGVVSVVEGASVDAGDVVKVHIHRYARGGGLDCLTPGCTATRTQPYIARAKKATGKGRR